MTDTTLWCVHTPDDSYVPVPTRRGGTMFAAEVNALCRREGWPATAEVVPWPLDAAEHQRHLDADQWPNRYYAQEDCRTVDNDSTTVRQLTAANDPELWEWADSKPRYDAALHVDGLTIYTPEGRMKADFGDYIVRDAVGAFWPVTPHIVSTDEAGEAFTRICEAIAPDGGRDRTVEVEGYAERVYDALANAGLLPIEEDHHV